MNILTNRNSKKLNLVSIPIGNIDDITKRAWDTLNESDIIFCENTKNSSIFLSKLAIKKPLESLHRFNEQEKVDRIIQLINDNKKVSLISDAGTPLINDPGTFIASKLIENDIMLYPIVGPSSLSATLSINSYNSDIITFLGFVDSKSSHKVKRIIDGEEDIICFVSPHFIVKLITKINNDSNREITICKEFTKIYETHIYSTTKEFLLNIENINIKGEYTLIIKKKEHSVNIVDISLKIQNYVDLNMSDKDIISKISSAYKIKKNELKKMILNIKENNEK